MHSQFLLGRLLDTGGKGDWADSWAAASTIFPWCSLELDTPSVEVKAAVLLNKTTFTRDFSCILLQVPCAHAYASWAVEGVVVTGDFHRDPEKSCYCCTVAIIHINSECTKRRSVCIALLLLIRDVCLKLGAVVLTG